VIEAPLRTALNGRRPVRAGHLPVVKALGDEAGRSPDSYIEAEKAGRASGQQEDRDRLIKATCDIDKNTFLVLRATLRRG
jgi:hypothetical protein